MAEPLSKVIQACEFEVFGKVQRVFMRKYTQAAANQLHIRGYVMNTPQSTVKGIALGSPENLDAFKQWLQTTGSPKSRVDRVEYKDLPIGDEVEVQELEQRYPEFSIDKSYGHAPRKTKSKSTTNVNTSKKTKTR